MANARFKKLPKSLRLARLRKFWGYLISPVARACFTSPINCVIGISRGQALVQLKAVRQRHTPICWFNTSKRSAAARSWFTAPDSGDAAARLLAIEFAKLAIDDKELV